ncbi:MAG: DUF488 domain-containing protein [Chloroflexota bacterium]|jgi:uncharacterized protein (DUF488 family)|nr:DUF488 domain-containing protein [Chloroflexota bacterium]
MSHTIYTVGHSNLSFLNFLSLIQANDITHIIDIRSIPYSRYAPWSNKSRLPDMLRPFNIRYTYLGHKLGGKKKPISETQRQQGVTSKEIYDEAIQLLLQLSLRDNLTLLCSEGDPANCHRQHIVAQTLLDSGTKVIHILKDGSLKEAWKENPTPDQPSLF